MDNVTHSIAGLLLAELAVQRRARANGEPPSPSFRRLAILTSLIGNNFPDLDFVYTGITHGKLGYLLHHRGHTHTLVGALFGIIFVGFGLVWLGRRFVPATARQDWRWIAILCGVGPLLHMAMDSMNNYGVHPFWPLDNRWYYGDAIFIIEPWYWVFSVPCLVLASRTWVVRVLLGLVLFAGVALAWLIDWVSWGVAAALTGGSLLSILVTAKLQPERRVLFGVLGVAGVTAIFFGASSLARARVTQPEQADAILTPGPSNPLCFSAIVVDVVPGTSRPSERVGSTERAASSPANSSVGTGELYRLRLATVPTFPALLPARSCKVQAYESTLPMQSVDRVDEHGVLWQSSWTAPLADFRALARTHCEFAALLRFTRAPFWIRLEGERLHVGDLRYDRERGEGFTEFQTAARPAKCPEWVPSWLPPRLDLLSGATP